MNGKSVQEEIVETAGVTVRHEESRTSAARDQSLKKGRPPYRTLPPGWRRFAGWMAADSQAVRTIVQIAFVLLCVWIGVEFFLFVRWGASQGMLPLVQRPPGVEGFLPISALISFKYWLDTGIINDIHPSGLFILLAVLITGFVFRKSFCSWLCPIGTISESLGALGKRIFGKTYSLPRILDLPLRGLKYLLFLFFAVSIASMDVESLRQFIYSPYNRMADVKMYLFFAEISGTALVIVGILVLLSVVVQHFWCRYLCPYGALLGIVGLLSPFKITRTPEHCIDCALCTKACPSRITVHTVTRVWSDECTSCLACVQACPLRDTLELRLSRRGKHIPTAWASVGIPAVFVIVIAFAMAAGHWENAIPSAEYQQRFGEIHTALYQHLNGHVHP